MKCGGLTRGTLLLSAKRSRLPGRWENTVRKTIWRTIHSANKTWCWGTGWVPSDFTNKTKQEFVVLARKHFQELFWATRWSREEFGEEIFWLPTWQIWTSWMHQVFIFEESTQGKYWSDKKMMNSFSQSQMAQQNCQEETRNSENALWGGDRPWGLKISVEKFKANRECLNRQNQQMTLKPVPTSGQSKVTSSIVITMNLGFNSTCRRKNNSPFHWNTLLLGQFVLIWMCYKRRVTIIGRSIRADICQILGKASQNSLHWKKNLRKDICGPGGDWQRFKRLPDQIIHVQKFGRKLVKPLKIEKDRNGQKKNRSLTMLKDWEEFTLSIQMTKSTKKFSKKREEKWKDLWLHPCRAKDNRASRKWLRSRKLGSEKNSTTVCGCKVESSLRCHKRWKFRM